MNPAIYVITYHDFNHTPKPSHKSARPLDPRFLNGKNEYIYYVIDKEVPEPLKNKKTILEYELDPKLHYAGSKYFGEWSFLLAEEKHQFCQYPLFMISSRFYEKNGWIHRSLDDEWDTLFNYLNEYRWGYLPSYCRPLTWIDLSWEKMLEKNVAKHQFFPFTRKSYETIEKIYGVNIPNDYRYMASLPCNYIGFKSRNDLLEYISFYKKLIHFYFDSEYQPRLDLNEYVKTTGCFRNEKVITHLLEQQSHLFFFKNRYKYFALHYDGYYRIDENAKEMSRLQKFHIPLDLKLERFLKWQYRKAITEGFLAPAISYLRRKNLFK